MKLQSPHPCWPGIALLAVLIASMEGRAGDRPPTDQDRALSARNGGVTLPLAQILAAVERQLVGRVIKTELDDDDGRLTYEFDLLLPDGRVIELKVDAHSGAWISLEGKHLETVFKPAPNRSNAPGAAR